MRTILFRGKRVDNGEWIEGNILTDKLYLRNPHICQKVTYCDFAPSFEDGMNLDEVMEKGSAYGLFLEVLPETVGQFTGLTDKNGSKIFEGDILHKMDTDYNTFNHDFSNEEFEEWEKTLVETFKGVATMDRFPSFWLENETFGYEGEDLQTPEEFEIIGNIYDNPELLTK